jgi:hypothetical protein
MLDEELLSAWPVGSRALAVGDRYVVAPSLRTRSTTASN